ncbi:hypothetical protein AYL99_03515 [Fonsecaea erecta]|uniref:Methyltransferase domain-containing protein n=1 Tax=Fonsecaea erecta TaxID=1367422 RepID=A0A178ZNB0_9EURO|nr:hypothetical protein AYL99_03515 [Fonsecaea erecta]OAP61314.1 hypothetical protein AYL99_03515 [Fonsecaea erecta]
MANPSAEQDEAHSPASGDSDVGEEVTILVDEEATERDSAYGDEISAYTASLTSSVNTFMMQYGRIYHTFRDQKSNMLPSDEQEFKRLDLHHALMLWLLGSRLHFAPIGSQPQRVLDLADQYPTAEVIGTDLTPIQPNFVPPNLKFIIDDFEEEWAYEHVPFDYVHGRYLASSVRDWPRLVQQSFQNLKPGGWAEFQDWDTKMYSKDDSLPEESALYKFHHYTCGRRTAAGYDSQPGPKLEGWLRDAGFINVHVVKLPIPLGTWPKDTTYKQVGICNYLQFQAGMEGIAIGCLVRTEPDPWSIEEVQALLAEARRDMRNPKIHGQYDL